MFSRFTAEVAELSGINVDYRRDGTLLVATNDHEQQELEAIRQAQTRRGLSIAALTGEAIHSRVPGLSPSIQYALFVPGDHWLDNEQLCVAVIAAGQRLGVRILSGHLVKKLNLENGRMSSVEAVSESGADVTFTASHFVLAAGCWSAALVEPLGIRLPMQPCRGQMMEFDTPKELPLVVRAGHHYLVPRSGGRVVAGTTVEYVGFEKAVTGEGLRSILQGVMRMTPLVKDFKFRRAWSGLRPDTSDHLPILGTGEIPNLVFATGHFRNGILLAPITAEIVEELIVKGVTSRPIEPYRPGRFA